MTICHKSYCVIDSVPFPIEPRTFISRACPSFWPSPARGLPTQDFMGSWDLHTGFTAGKNVIDPLVWEGLGSRGLQV